MKFDIIPAQEEHLAAAADIAIEAWTPIREVFRRELGDVLYEAAFDGWQEAKRNGVMQELRSGRGFVAIMEGRVVGFISYTVNEARAMGTIGTNAVSSSCRGHGVGPAMYAFVQEEMRREGMKFASVTTGGDDGHAPARRAYEKAGFKRFLPSVKYYKEL